MGNIRLVDKENNEMSKKEVQLLSDSAKKKLDLNMYLDAMRFGSMPRVEDVIYNNPLTIVNWSDGVKTIVKCRDGEAFNEYMGFLACVAKRVFGGHGHYRQLIEKANRVSTEDGITITSSGWLNPAEVKKMSLLVQQYNSRKVK